MNEENKEFKTFFNNIKSKMIKKNIIVAFSSVLITIFTLLIVFLIYNNVKFPIPLDTVFIEWVAEYEATNLNEIKILDSISFEITNIGKQHISKTDMLEEGDVIIIKLYGNLGNKLTSTVSFEGISIKDKNAIYIQGKDENDRLLVWEKNMEIMTKEEWTKWYYDVFSLKNPMIRFQKSRQTQ